MRTVLLVRAKGRIIENPNASNYVVAEAAAFATKIGGICSV